MNDQLQQRLLNYEVEPPTNMWDAINDALDDQTAVAAEKLRQLEAMPPTRLWNNIETALDTAEEQPAKSRPFYRRYAIPLRYAGAAAVLVLVALSITFFFNNSGESREIARREVPTRSTRPVIKPADQVPTIRESENPQEKRALSRAKASKINVEDRTEFPDADNSITMTDKAAAVKTTSSRIPANRYLTVASETGKPVRLSKKVLPVFDCAEHSDALERFRCQENIETLQKMASSLISPSGDFASLIDMIKTLEEKR